MKKILIAFYLIFVVTHVCAIDKYDEKTNQLTISSVLAGANTYNNVVANVGTVLSMGIAPQDGEVDFYNLTNGQLTIPSVSAYGTTFYNVVVTLGSILSVGSLNQSTNSFINSFNGESLICGKFDKLQLGDYIASPSAWASQLPAGYQDCVGISSITNGVQFNSKWSLPTSVTGAIYPEIIYGLKGGFSSANSKLPKSIASTNNLIVSWNYNFINNGINGDVLVETWLTNTPNPKGLAPYQGTMVELGVFLENFGNWSINTSLPVVTVGGKQYYLSVGNDSGAPSNTYGTIQSGNAPYQYRAFFTPLKSLGRNGSIDMKLFAQYLIDNNYLPNGLYFSALEFGTEIQYGSGELQMNNFNVTVK